MPQTSPWEMAPGSALRKLDNVFSPNSAAGRPAAGVFKKNRKNGGKGLPFPAVFFKRSGAYSIGVYPSGMAIPSASPMTVLNLGVKFSA